MLFDVYTFNSGWILHSTALNRHAAEALCRQLEAEGFKTKVELIR